MEKTNFVQMGKVMECGHCYLGKYEMLPASMKCECQCHDDPRLSVQDASAEDSCHLSDESQLKGDLVAISSAEHETMEERFDLLISQCAPFDTFGLWKNADFERLKKGFLKEQKALVEAILEKKKDEIELVVGAMKLDGNIVLVEDIKSIAASRGITRG